MRRGPKWRPRSNAAAMAERIVTADVSIAEVAHFRNDPARAAALDEELRRRERDSFERWKRRMESP